MLVEGNTGTADAVERLIGREALPFTPDSLRYLKC